MLYLNLGYYYGKLNLPGLEMKYTEIGYQKVISSDKTNNKAYTCNLMGNVRRKER